MLRSSLALLGKDLRVTLRSPLFAILSVLVPVAFTMLYAIVIHVSTTSSIAVAVDDDSAEARAFVGVLRSMHNDDGRYYEIRTTDPVRARRMYTDGDVGALLTVPNGFGADVRTGVPASVSLDVVNINADGVKNQQLRLEQAVREFSRHRDAGDGRLTIVEDPVLDHDIPVTVYLGSALIVLTVLYAGIVNAGTLLTREWEERTAKGLLLAPTGRGALIVGKWLSTAVVSLITVLIGVVGIAWILDYPVAQIGPSAVGVLTVVWLYGAALGTLLGITLRRSLPLVPIAVIVAVAHFLVCGYESYIRGFAHGGVVEVLWASTAWIPLSALVDAFRFEVSGLEQPAGTGPAFVAGGGLAVAVAAVAFWRLHRTVRFTQGQ